MYILWVKLSIYIYPAIYIVYIYMHIHIYSLSWSMYKIWGPFIEAVMSLRTHITLQWHHNDHDGVSNRQPHGSLLNRLFRRGSKKTSKPRVTGLCVGNSPGPVNSPHKGPVTRKMFPFDDVIMKPVKPTIDSSCPCHALLVITAGNWCH